MYLLAVNCGSSSIKGKLYAIPPAKSDPLGTVADLGVSNISSMGEKVKIKVTWSEGKGKNVNEEGEDGGSVECEACRRRLADGRRFARPAVVGQALKVGFPRQGRHQICHAQSVRKLDLTPLTPAQGPRRYAQARHTHLKRSRGGSRRDGQVVRVCAAPCECAAMSVGLTAEPPRRSRGQVLPRRSTSPHLATAL